MSDYPHDGDYGEDGAIVIALRTGMPLDLAREVAAAVDVSTPNTDRDPSTGPDSPRS